MKRIAAFFGHGIWQPRLRQYQGLKGLLFRTLRILVLASREFMASKCTIKASALTFYTLLSLVPVLTMALAIARAFGLDALLQRHVWADLNGQGVLVDKILAFAQSMLKSTTNGVVTGIGVVVLLWSVTSMLRNIEYAFDQIWEAPKARNPVRQVTDYVAMVVVGTVLWLISIGLAVTLQSKFGPLAQQLSIPEPGLVLSWVLRVLRFGLIWLLFLTAYIIMPNIRIRRRSAVLGGFWATVLYHAVEWVYITFQVGAARYGAAYGGFAALPLFLAWVQITWMIVLFGAELSFADENAETFGYAPNYSKLSMHVRKVLKVRIVHLLAVTFEHGKGALNSNQISERIEVPARLLRQLLRELAASGLLSRVTGKDETKVAYQPALGAEQLTLGYTLDRIECYEPGAGADSGAGTLMAALQQFHDATFKLPANVRLADIPLANQTMTSTRNQT